MKNEEILSIVTLLIVIITAVSVLSLASADTNPKNLTVGSDQIVRPAQKVKTGEPVINIHASRIVILLLISIIAIIWESISSSKAGEVSPTNLIQTTGEVSPTNLIQTTGDISSTPKGILSQIIHIIVKLGAAFCIGMGVYKCCKYCLGVLSTSSAISHESPNGDSIYSLEQIFLGIMVIAIAIIGIGGGILGCIASLIFLGIITLLVIADAMVARIFARSSRS